MLKEIREICRISPGVSVTDFLRKAFSKSSDKSSGITSTGLQKGPKVSKRLPKEKRQDLIKVIQYLELPFNVKDSSKRLLRMIEVNLDRIPEDSEFLKIVNSSRKSYKILKDQ